jgi:arylsulfatase A-like enzyme
MQSVFDELDWDDFAEAIRCYYATCSMIDAEVGKTLDTLEEMGLAEDTVVVLLSDHGDCLGAHRILTKGATPYEEVYNVPLVISAPGFARGEVCDHITSTGDLCPTVLELSGLDSFGHGHFRSLIPLLEDPDTDEWEDEAYAEFHGQRYAFTQRIIWHDHLKYVMNAYDFDEMYDLCEDPAELENIAEDPSRVAEKEALLKRIWSKIHETGDTTMANAHYWSLRFFDLGPDCVDHD